MDRTTKPCIVMIGDLADGFFAYGPFKNYDEAENWIVDSQISENGMKDRIFFVSLLPTESINRSQYYKE